MSFVIFPLIPVSDSIVGTFKHSKAQLSMLLTALSQNVTFCLTSGDRSLKQICQHEKNCQTYVIIASAGNFTCSQ